MRKSKKNYFVQLSGATIWPEACQQLSRHAELKMGILDGRVISQFEQFFPNARLIDGTSIKHGVWNRNNSASLPNEIRLHPAFLRREQQAFYGMQRQFTGGTVSYTDMRIFLSSLADYLWGVFKNDTYSFGIYTEAPHTHGGQILAGIAEACEVPILHFQQTSICSAVQPLIGPNYHELHFEDFETDDDRLRRVKFLEEEFPVIEQFVKDAEKHKRYSRELTLLERDRHLFGSPKGVVRRFFVPYFWRLEEAKMLQTAIENGDNVPHSVGAITPSSSITNSVIAPALLSTIRQSRALKRCRDSLGEASTTHLPDNYATFFLHFEPEKTSVPDGGLFGDQILAVRRCAEALDRSAMLVVREHPSQLTLLKRGFRARSASFYRELNAIPNVTIVSESVPHSQILQGSRVVFTLTGKVALEALASRIPVVSLGHAWYQGLPGIFGVGQFETVAECIAASESYMFPGDFDLTTEIEAKLSQGFIQVRVNPSSSRHFEGREDLVSLVNLLQFFADNCPTSSNSQSSSNS